MGREFSDVKVTFSKVVVQVLYVLLFSQQEQEEQDQPNQNHQEFTHNLTRSSPKP